MNPPPPPLQVERISHIIIFNIIKKILEFNILLLKYTPKLTIYHNLPHTMSFCAMRLLHVSKNNLTPPPPPPPPKSKYYRYATATN